MDSSNSKKRHLLVVFVAILTADCTGSPAKPSGLKGQLEGQWNGTLTMTVGGETFTSPVSVVFTTTPDTGGIGYQSSLRTSNAYFQLETAGEASTGWPGTPPTRFDLNHNYPSRFGTCRGSFNASGMQESARHISADVLGFEACAQNYRGRLSLDRR